MAEIARKRKEVDDHEAVTKKKYMKQGDLAVSLAKEKEKQKQTGPSSEADHSKEEKEEEQSSSSCAKEGKAVEKKYANVSKADLYKRLRERGEPIKLFGESHEEACHRLRLVEMMAKEENKGLRNDFKAAMDRLDQAYIDQLTSESGSGSDQKSSKAHDVKIDENVLPLDDIFEMAEKIRQGDMQLDSKVVYEYLRHMGYLWGSDLNDRDPKIKMELEGKLKSARYEQTMAYLKPLLRKLKGVSLSSDILGHLGEIVRHCIARDYVKASDQYLQMAIGNAPWPIGVTNPGIHARTGREKISTSLVAHVLNDETQRKYIQGLKRIMTYCQKKFPADPSKSVEYKGVDV